MFDFDRFFTIITLLVDRIYYNDLFCSRWFNVWLIWLIEELATDLWEGLMHAGLTWGDSL